MKEIFKLLTDLHTVVVRWNARVMLSVIWDPMSEDYLKYSRRLYDLERR